MFVSIWFLVKWANVVLPIAILLLVLAGAYLLARHRRPTATSSAQFPVWDPQNQGASLTNVFNATVQQGEAAIDWYRENIRANRLGSRIIRLVAIVLASIGALIPLIVTAVQGHFQLDAQWGYIAFAAAAVAIAIDKFYGFSSGWTRYIKTQIALERALTDLRYDWTLLLARLDKPPNAEQVQVMLQKLKEFVDFAHTQIQVETEAWVLEFQASLADLTSAVKSRAESAKPGSVQLTVPNAKEFDGGVKALLDHMDERQVEGTQCLFPSVAPGPHEVLVTGKKGDKAFDAAGVVRVTSDSLAAVSISLPVS